MLSVTAKSCEGNARGYKSRGHIRQGIIVQLSHDHQLVKENVNNNISYNTLVGIY